MLKRSHTKECKVAIGSVAILAAAFLAGCKGMSTRSESAARRDMAAVQAVYRPNDTKPPLPELATNAPLSAFLERAMLNQPQVEAAYYEWAASVERITRERSLPDPRLTFESDISDMVESLMPGLMMDLPGPGKLRLRGDVAAGESAVKYFAFEEAALRAAALLKRSYYQLHFLDEKIRITRATAQLVEELELVARKQHEVGKVTMQDVLRAQIEESRLATELANLDDSRAPLLAQFKAALGLTTRDPNPPLPASFETTTLEMDADRLLETAKARNPRIRGMEAEVRRAAVSIDLAYRARVPDFTVGVDVDVKASPVMVRPEAGMSLPIWRDKISAELREAQAIKRSAEARLSGEQIMLAVELAEKLFMYREATRNLTLYQESLLPKARMSLEVARSSYVTGATGFFDLIDAWRTQLGFELAQVEARTQRELLLTDISLLIAGIAPGRAPFLPIEPTQNGKDSHAN